jgi:hypothetical protein
LSLLLLSGRWLLARLAWHRHQQRQLSEHAAAGAKPAGLAIHEQRSRQSR